MWNWKQLFVTFQNNILFIRFKNYQNALSFLMHPVCNTVLYGSTRPAINHITILYHRVICQCLFVCRGDPTGIEPRARQIDQRH